MLKRIKEVLDSVYLIQREIDENFLPKADGNPSKKHQIIYESLFLGTPPSVKQICHQINGCYENGWYDACAVMIRRLLETLIIELFESKNIANKIQKNGDFLYLKDLISLTLVEPSWNLGRNTKSSLPKLKDVGDKSAHSRRFLAQRQDIDDIKSDLRVVVQEFLLLSGLKK